MAIIIPSSKYYLLLCVLFTAVIMLTGIVFKPYQDYFAKLSSATAASVARQHEATGKLCATVAALFDSFMALDTAFVHGVATIQMTMEMDKPGVKLVRSMGDLKEHAGKAKLSEAASLAFRQFEDRCGVKNVGEAIKSVELGAFKKELLEQVVQPIISSDMLTKADAEKVAVSCQSIKDSVHKIMQVTWWSESATFDRACVQFAVDVVVEIAQASGNIYNMSADPSAPYSVNERLLKAFGYLSKMDEATPRLIWLFGATVADSFMQKGKQLRGHLMPRHEQHSAELHGRLDICTQKLSDKLVKESPAKPLPVDDFHMQLTQKDIIATSISITVLVSVSVSVTVLTQYQYVLLYQYW